MCLEKLYFMMSVQYKTLGRKCNIGSHNILYIHDMYVHVHIHMYIPACGG